MSANAATAASIFDLDRTLIEVRPVRSWPATFARSAWPYP